MIIKQFEATPFVKKKAPASFDVLPATTHKTIKLADNKTNNGTVAGFYLNNRKFINKIRKDKNRLWLIMQYPILF